MNAKQFFEAGQLKEAIDALNEEVKKAPRDLEKRGFLCELLCFAGNLDRADANLTSLGTLDPQAMIGVSLFRQLVRAEQARQQFYTDGRLPEFLFDPSPAMKLHLEASIRVREGKNAEAVELLAKAEEERVKVSGTYKVAGEATAKPFADLRDCDDLTSCFFEVLTSNGKYYWIPVERTEQIEFHAPARPRDLLWRRAHMVVKDGPDGEVYFPCLYAGAAADVDQRVALGRVTDYQGGDGKPVRGIGQRTLLLGDEAVNILALADVSINLPEGPAATEEPA